MLIIITYQLEIGFICQNLAGLGLKRTSFWVVFMGRKPRFLEW